MGLQSHRSPNSRILGLSEENDIWVLISWPRTKNIIKGKVVASPSPSCGEFCESVFVRSCRNLNLGLATESRGCKVAGQVGDLGAFHMLPGVQRM